MKRRLGLHGTVVARVAPPLFTRSPSGDGAQTGRPAVIESIGLDRHTRERQLASNADDGTITDRRLATSRERSTAVLGARPRARMRLEASTERAWVARHLETLGHEGIVVDPNDAPMSATRSRRSKWGINQQVKEVTPAEEAAGAEQYFAKTKHRSDSAS